MFLFLADKLISHWESSVLPIPFPKAKQNNVMISGQNEFLNCC